MDFTPAVIDPTLARGVAPPAIEDPLVQQQRAQALAAQRQQMQQSAATTAQQLQAGAQEIQAKQIQMDQNKAINDAYAAAYKIDPTTGQGSLDTEGLSKALAQGGHGSAIPTIIEATTKAHKAIADLAETQGKVRDQQSDAAGSLGASVRAANYDPHLFLTQMQNAVDQKAVDPGIVAPIIAHIQQLLQADPSGASAAPEVKAAVDHMIAQSPKQSATDSAAVTAAARKQASQTAADTAAIKKPGEQAAADQAVLVNAAQQLHAATDQASYSTILGGLPPKVAVQFPPSFDANTPAAIDRVAMTPEQRTQADAAAATLRETKTRDTNTALNEAEGRRQRDAQIRLDQQRIGIEQKKFDATFGQGLDANGHPLSPEERKNVALNDPTAVAQANYQIPPPSSARTTALGKAQWDKILAIDPNYDGTKFPTRNKIAQDFGASGASGKAMTSSDTALAHLDTISRAGRALDNGDFKALNGLALSLGAQVGASPKNTYDTIVSMVAPEISKAVIGEAGGEGERQNMALQFGSNLSNPVREQAIGAAAGLLGARVHKMAQAYESDMGKPLARKLSPESQSVLDRYAGGGAAGAGGQQAAPYKPGDKRTINGKTYVRGADGKWTTQ